MDRCALAYEYHKQGYNCAQSVVGAFSDLTGMDLKQIMAVAGGFGSGVGGSHAELCGALSGAVVVLSLLYPHTDGADTAAKKRLYGKCSDLYHRFCAIFGKSRCGDLMKDRPAPGSQTPAAQRLGITAHCDIMIVTAVELLEQMLQEETLV